MGLSAATGATCEAEVVGVIAAGISFILLFDGSASAFLPNLKKSRFRSLPALSVSPAPACTLSDPSECGASGIRGAVDSLDCESAVLAPVTDALFWDMAAAQEDPARDGEPPAQLSLVRSTDLRPVLPDYF